MLFQFFVFLLSVALLVKASEIVVRESVRAANFLGLSTFALGFILISVSTSLPELAIALFSVVNSEPGLSIGNVLGANLADLTLILGLCLLFGGRIEIEERDFEDLIELLFVVSLIILLLLYTPEPHAIVGIVLLALFPLLLLHLYRKGSMPKELFADRKETTRAALLKLALSLILLMIAAHLLVHSAVEIAHFLGISTTLFGATFIAISTTMPELTVELRAIKRGNISLALGDLFGSAVTNITLVLGIAILGSANSSYDSEPLFGIIPFLFLAIFILWYWLAKKHKLGKKHGLLLVAIYIMYLLEEYGLFALR